MEMIIAILLWLQVMVSPGQYTHTQYDALVQQHDQQINAVLSDPQLQQTVWASTGDQVPYVVVGDGD